MINAVRVIRTKSMWKIGNSNRLSKGSWRPHGGSRSWNMDRIIPERRGGRELSREGGEVQIPEGLKARTLLRGQMRLPRKVTPWFCKRSEAGDEEPEESFAKAPGMTGFVFKAIILLALKRTEWVGRRPGEGRSQAATCNRAGGETGGAGFSRGPRSLRPTTCCSLAHHPAAVCRALFCARCLVSWKLQNKSDTQTLYFSSFLTVQIRQAWSTAFTGWHKRCIQERQKHQQRVQSNP